MGGGLPSAHELVVLCLRDDHRLVERAQVLVELRQAFVVFGLERPGQEALQALHAPDERSLEGRRCILELFLDVLDTRKHGLLFTRREKLGPRRRQQIVTAFHEHLVLFPAQTQSRIKLAELGVHVRKQRLIVIVTYRHHVVEGVETRLPADELLAQVCKVEVILQARLEVVRRKEFHQVIGLRRLGQRAQAYDPVLVLAYFLADECFEKTAVSDALDRLVELVDFGAKGIERTTIVNGRPPVDIQFAVRVREREHGLLRCAVGYLAFREDAPRNDGAIVLFDRQARPARAQECLVRERPVEPDAVEIRHRLVVFAILQQDRAEHQVGLVPDRELRRVVRGDLAGAIELLDGRLALAVLQIGDAEVIGRKTAIAVGSLQALEHLEGFDRFFLSQVDVGPQEFDIVPNAFGDLAVDAVQRQKSVFHLALLEMDPRKTIGSIVAHHLIDGAFQHRRYRAPCPVMHPVTQLEVAERKLRVDHVIVQRIEFRLVEAGVLVDFGVEALQRLEVVPLVRVIERLAEVEILQLFAISWTRCQTGDQQEPDP